MTQSNAAVWTIRDRDGNVTTRPADPEALISIPQHLPTYRRLSVLHTGEPDMETRLRAASLEDSCAQLGTPPPCRALMDEIHQTGRVSDQQANSLRKYLQTLDDDQYLADETRLLLEAAGHEADLVS